MCLFSDRSIGWSVGQLTNNRHLHPSVECVRVCVCVEMRVWRRRLVIFMCFYFVCYCVFVVLADDKNETRFLMKHFSILVFVLVTQIHIDEFNGCCCFFVGCCRHHHHHRHLTSVLAHFYGCFFSSSLNPSSSSALPLPLLIIIFLVYFFIVY